MKHFVLSIATAALSLTTALALTGCVDTSGLKAQAASDMSCEEDKLSTRKIKGGYSGDDFGAQYEVEGCGEKVMYEKKGPANWKAVSEAEDVE